jgi:hypothetical protein
MRACGAQKSSQPCPFESKTNHTSNPQNGFTAQGPSPKLQHNRLLNLLVESLSVGGGGGDVSIAGSLVGAGGLLEVLGSSHVSSLSGVVPAQT